MARLATPPSIRAVHVHGKTGISYLVFALFALAHAYVLQWMWQTVGEPFRVASEQNERITATNALLNGVEDRNLLQLQSGRKERYKQALAEERKVHTDAMAEKQQQIEQAVTDAQVTPRRTRALSAHLPLPS